MIKRLFISFNLFLFGLLSACSAADRSSNKEPNEIASKLVADGNVKWIFDTERTSGDLGNDPENNCIIAYHFNSKGNMEKSCLNGSNNTNKAKEKRTEKWSLSKSSIMIDGAKFAVLFSKDACFMRLSGVFKSETGGNDVSRNIVFKREPLPPTGCKD